jgi:hypothetical protein
VIDTSSSDLSVAEAQVQRVLADILRKGPKEEEVQEQEQV